MHPHAEPLAHTLVRAVATVVSAQQQLAPSSGYVLLGWVVRAGGRFVLKDFHGGVLKAGSVPLDVPRDVVPDWAHAPLN
jgi:hypothetical protein